MSFKVVETWYQSAARMQMWAISPTVFEILVLRRKLQKSPFLRTPVSFNVVALGDLISCELTMKFGRVQQVERTIGTAYQSINQSGIFKVA